MIVVLLIFSSGNAYEHDHKHCEVDEQCESWEVQKPHQRWVRVLTCVLRYHHPVPCLRASVPIVRIRAAGERLALLAIRSARIALFPVGVIPIPIRVFVFFLTRLELLQRRTGKQAWVMHDLDTWNNAIPITAWSGFIFAVHHTHARENQRRW